MKVVCVGDCGIDHYLPTDVRLCGGITANFARHAAALFPASDPVHIVSALGNDADASRVREALAATRVICHFTETEGRTPVQHIRLHADGEREFVGYDEGVLAGFRIGPAAAALIRSADLLVVPVFVQMRALFASVLEVPVRGMVAVDFADFAQHPDFEHFEAWIERIDVAFFGLTSTQGDLITRLCALSERADCTIVVTLGAEGSHAFVGGNRHECTALPVDPVVDTTGAGDSFAAGFLSAYCKDGDIDRALAAGAARAAQVVQHLGAWPGD